LRPATALIPILLLLAFPSLLPGAPAPAAGEAYVFPSPATPQSCPRMVFSMQEAGSATVRVYHEDGTLAARYSNRHAAGLQVLPLGCVFAPGMYFYRVTLHYESGLVEKPPAGWFVVSP